MKDITRIVKCPVVIYVYPFLARVICIHMHNVTWHDQLVMQMRHYQWSKSTW